MAVNKNFVVKNGLEVNADLILADSNTKRVGIGSTIPGYTLEVVGGIGATDIYVSGLSTFVGFSTFQDSIGVQNDITIAGISTVVGVATFRDNVFIDGNLNVAGDITYDEVNGRNIYISGLSTFVGFATFNDSIGIQKDISIAGMSTVVGVATFRSNVFVDGDLNVAGDIAYDEVTGRNIYISGLSTFVGVSTFESTLFAKNVVVSGVSSILGFTTISDNVFIAGYSTVTQDLSVLGDLNVTGDISYDEVTGRNINITGLSTFAGLSYFGSNVGVGTTNPTGTGALTSNTKTLAVGVVTANYLYGDISNTSGVSTNISAAVGVSSEGTFVGGGSTIINFTSSSGSGVWDVTVSGGIATAKVTPGVSLGLAIALGG